MSSSKKVCLRQLIIFIHQIFIVRYSELPGNFNNLFVT